MRRYWEGRWRNLDARPKWLEGGPRAQVRAARESGWLPPSASIVDVGCGVGRTTAWLASLGHRVLGIDVAAAAIEQARQEHHGVPGLTFQRADVTRPIKSAGPHDVVLDLGCFHQLPPKTHEGYAANIRRLSVAGSRCLYLVRIRDGEHDHSLDAIARNLQTILGPEFTLQLVEYTEMQASHTAEILPGAELRFLRR
jgi:SAM-dependent methyltransferase